MQGWTATIRHGVTRKRGRKDKSIQESYLARTLRKKVSIKSRVTVV